MNVHDSNISLQNTYLGSKNRCDSKTHPSDSGIIKLAQTFESQFHTPISVKGLKQQVNRVSITVSCSF